MLAYHRTFWWLLDTHLHRLLLPGRIKINHRLINLWIIGYIIYLMDFDVLDSKGYRSEQYRYAKQTDIRIE
jgi:hypothetical protein